MKKIIFVLLALIFLGACGNDNVDAETDGDVGTDDDVVMEERRGMAEDLSDSALEIAETIREMYFEQELTYDDLDVDSKEYEIISNFDINRFKNKDEEFSKRENYLFSETQSLISDYMLHQTKTSEGTTRERATEMMEKIQNIEKTVNEEGFYPY